MSPLNILFTSCGRRVSLIRHFKQVLNEMDRRAVVVCADLKRNAPALYECDFSVLVPSCTDSDYILKLKQICQRFQIRLLVPLIDTELYLLSQHRREFQEVGVTVLVSSPETNLICSGKRRVYDFFRSIGVKTPEILDPTALLLDDALGRYPVMLKPDCGSSSEGAVLVRSREDLQFFLGTTSDPLVQEFIPGDEYTVDVLVDFQGKVRCVIPRLRIETRAGEVSKAMTVKNFSIIDATKRTVEALPGTLGCLTVQCILENNSPTFIEINPRFGGGFPLAIRAGADFPRWIVEMMLNREPSLGLTVWEDGVLMLRFDEAIFRRQEELAG